jgi:hypothetical protein
MKKIIITAVAVGVFVIALGIVVFIRYRSDSMKWYRAPLPVGMYPKWEGFDLRHADEFRGGGDDIVCIIQYMYQPSRNKIDYETDYKNIQKRREETKEVVTKKMRKEIKDYEVYGDYPLLSYIPVKAWSDRNSINRIIGLLHTPEEKNRSNVETEDYLVVVRIDRELNSQEIVRVPFKLTDDGFAITPRGKDKTLYELLSAGLEEWKARKQAEEDRIEAIYRLHRQARDSENVDYNALFLELQKLDGLFEAKDPNELEQKMKKWEEGQRQMLGYDDPNNPTKGGWL